MKKIIKIVSLILILTTLVYAAPARGGVRVFEQPDGTTFSGILKGDASFHWIESNSNIVLFNPKDNFYYNAKVAKNGQLEFTNKKVKDVRNNAPALNRSIGEQIHRISSSEHKALMQLVKKAKKGNYPR